MLLTSLSLTCETSNYMPLDTQMIYSPMHCTLLHTSKSLYCHNISYNQYLSWFTEYKKSFKYKANEAYLQIPLYSCVKKYIISVLLIKLIELLHF